MSAPTGEEFDPLEVAAAAGIALTSPVHLVGGRVRDAIMGRWTNDTDLVVPHGARAAAASIADRTGGRCVELDRDRDVARVVWAGSEATLDIAALAADTLEADLLLRDFTVNAIAAPLTDWRATGPYIDPAGGQADVAARRLRLVSDDAIQRDPLRMLRGVRLATELGFELDSWTVRSIKQQAHLAGTPSPERTRDELMRIVHHANAGRGIALIDALGLDSSLGLFSTDRVVWNGWELIRRWIAAADGATERDVEAMPEHGGRLASPTDEGLVPAHRTIARFREGLDTHLGEHVAARRLRRDVVGLAALLDPADESVPTSIASALRLSNGERGVLEGIWLAARLWRQAAAAGGAGAPAHRMFRAAGAAAVDAILLALAPIAAAGDGPDGLGGSPPGATPFVDAAREPEVDSARELAAANKALSLWFGDRARLLPEPLLSGADLMAELRIPSSPLVGRILNRILEAQADGLVSDRDAALGVAREALASLSKEP